MADGFEIDTSELDRLVVDLGRASGRVVKDAEPVLKKGANNLKTEMQAAFSDSTYFKAVAPAVSYERRGFTREVAFEVGPEMGRGAGSLAHIAVDGGANGGGGKVEIDGLLAAEAKNVEKYLGKVIEGLL